MRMLFVRLLTGVVLCALFGGCAWKGMRTDVRIREYLEEATGTSVTYVSVHTAFVHKEPALASSGRDYIYLGPIAVNRGGERSFWLWLGVWSTVDRKAHNAVASPLSIGPIQILADDEPMEFKLQSVDANPAGIRRIPYWTPVTTHQEYLVQVTRSQFQRLGHARVVTLTDSPAAGMTRVWRGDDRATAVLSRFAEEVSAAGSNAGQ